MTPLRAFYLGSHADHRGRTLAQILRQDDDWLEAVHDYIQWLFPLDEHSRAVPGSPTLSRADIEAFRTDPLLRQHMLAAWRRMLGFYGLRVGDDGAVAQAPNWAERKPNWFTQPTHNSLRITRILKSLVLVGLESEAARFQACLLGLCASEPDCGIPAASQAFWRQAVVRPH
jgi:hypothetical protein